MEDPPLASLSLTHVHYVRTPRICYSSSTPIFMQLTRLQNPNDPISYASAWLALVPQALCVIYVTLIWASREVEILLMFAGQMSCEVLNFLLKRLIREERPRRANIRNPSLY